MAILLDYSQVALSNVFQFQANLKKSVTAEKAADGVNIIRHAVLTGIKSYHKKHKKQFGHVVIACDGKNYWRKQVFEHYKAHRSKNREDSDLDWKLIFNTIDQLRDDIKAVFPYRVVRVDIAEADDVIGTLCHWFQDNEAVDHGMFEERQPIMIISSDGDFISLQKYGNVQQWSPIHKKKVTSDNPQRYLLEKIARGDTGDGIPNVLSDDNVLITEGVRQKKMMTARLEEFADRGIDACRSDYERRNWERNRRLIDLDYIPTDVRDQIINAYTTSKPKGTKMDVFNYLVKHKCRHLIDELEEFF